MKKDGKKRDGKSNLAFVLDQRQRSILPVFARAIQGNAPVNTRDRVYAIAMERILGYAGGAR
jgi:hypothetical protein